MAKILGSALYFLYISPQEAGHGTILIEQNASVLVFRELIFPSFELPAKIRKSEALASCSTKNVRSFMKAEP